MVTPPESESLFIEYNCGNGADPGLQTYIDVIFAYEIHNKLDTAAIDALKEAKKLMLADIARRLGCSESFNRNMQQSEDNFSKIIGISSSKVDGLDPDVAGCTEEVQVNTQTTCTPAKGGFTLFVKSGTDQVVMNDISDRVKSIIEYSMTLGEYETGFILKAVYIGDRVQNTPDSIITYTEPDPSKASEYALYALIVACLILLCLLCMTLRSSRRRTRKQLRKEDEELAFDQYMENYNRPVSLGHNDAPQHFMNGQNPMHPTTVKDAYMKSQSQIPRNTSRRSVYRDDLARPGKRGSTKGSRREIDQSGYQRASNLEGESDHSGGSRESNGTRDYPEALPPRPPPPRSKSTPIIMKQPSRRKPPPAKMMNLQSEDDSSDESSSSSSESDKSQDTPPPPVRRENTNESASALAKDERRQRLEAAKARAASRRSASLPRTLT